MAFKVQTGTVCFILSHIFQYVCPCRGISVRKTLPEKVSGFLYTFPTEICFNEKDALLNC